MRTPPGAPAPIRTDHSNAFANNTMRFRLPAIIDETLALNPDFIPHILRRLSRLRNDIANSARIQDTELAPAGDTDAWSQALQRQREIVGDETTWQNAEWFFAETYFYRCLIEAVRWHETGRDPFLPKKREELHSEALWGLLERACQPLDAPEREISRAVEYALWGNRIDLSYAPSLERGAEIGVDDLLVDDRDALAASLFQSNASSPGSWNSATIYIVADNAGTELAMDLVLADCLLRHATRRVGICLKFHPTFVSDAIVEDVWMLLREMACRDERIAALAERLVGFWKSGRLRFLPHPYWNSSRFLWDLPAGFRCLFDEARLVIIKGDANYRRAVGDAIWPAHTPFADVLSYFDVPVLCLRTLKSDPVVGLPLAGTAGQLDSEDPQWRVNGRRGVIQFKPQTSNNQ